MINSLKKQVNNNLNNFYNALSYKGKWTLSDGVVDCYGNKFPIPIDTKVISKLFESQLESVWKKFCKENNYTIEFATKQNQYPDLTLKCYKTNNIYAVDEKSSYKKTNKLINGMTLGTYKGYFRDTMSCKNTLYPYDSYKEHFVFGILYNREENTISDIEIFFTEKWRVASKTPGSGNTTNIGSIKKIKSIIEEKDNLFKSKNEFENYWRNYE